MCADKTSQDPCSCCPEIIAVQVIDEEPDTEIISAIVHQPVKNFKRQHLMPRVPVPTRVKSKPVPVGVRF
jgi:ethanolamine utilization cobalamin adenosyltransferase